MCTYATTPITHDAASNLTFNDHFKHAFDAWGPETGQDRLFVN